MCLGALRYYERELSISLKINILQLSRSHALGFCLVFLLHRARYRLLLPNLPRSPRDEEMMQCQRTLSSWAEASHHNAAKALQYPIVYARPIALPCRPWVRVIAWQIPHRHSGMPSLPRVILF